MPSQCYCRLQSELMLVCLLAFLQITSAWETPNCLTPFGIPGHCVPIETCQTSQWILNARNTPEQRRYIEDYVRRSHCGKYGNTYYSCCAENELIRPHASKLQTWSNYLSHPESAVYPQKQHLTLRQTSYGETILSSQKCGHHNGQRIAYGDQVLLGEFPWMALLEYSGTTSRDRFKCSGTLITDRYVLSAAHCVIGLNEIISVRLGEHDISNRIDCNNMKKFKLQSYCLPPAIDVPVEKAIVHENYDKRTMTNDIALLRLGYPVQFTIHIKPICLPLQYKITSTPETQLIAGWGLTEKGYASKVLLKTSVNIKDFGVCQKTYRQAALGSSTDKICAGNSERRGNTCRGDSGGPMFAITKYGSKVRYTQFGIISSGFSRCDNPNNYPAIFTKVYNYMDWIIGQIEE